MRFVSNSFADGERRVSHPRRHVVTVCVTAAVGLMLMGAVASPTFAQVTADPVPGELNTVEPALDGVVGGGGPSLGATEPSDNQGGDDCGDTCSTQVKAPKKTSSIVSLASSDGKRTGTNGDVRLEEADISGEFTDGLLAKCTFTGTVRLYTYDATTKNESLFIRIMVRCPNGKSFELSSGFDVTSNTGHSKDPLRARVGSPGLTGPGIASFTDIKWDPKKRSLAFIYTVDGFTGFK